MEVSESSMGAHANLYISLDTDLNKKNICLFNMGNRSENLSSL